MAILGPNDLPVVLKVDSNPMKAYCNAKLGYPNTAVELHETQWEIVMRIAGDFIAGYFPREQKLAVFYTTPLQPTYPMPTDAYWIQEVTFDATTTRIDDIFGSESFLFNIGQVSGLNNMLTDYHLLQAYRKFSSRIIGTEAHWEVLNEGGDGPTQQKIRIYPTPKGVFPVLVLYYPVVTHFRSPQAKRLAYDTILAEAMEMVGMSRRKMANMPSPGSGTLTLDGEALIADAKALKERVLKDAIDLGEPMPIVVL